MSADMPHNSEEVNLLTCHMFPPRTRSHSDSILESFTFHQQGEERAHSKSDSEPTSTSPQPTSNMRKTFPYSNDHSTNPGKPRTNRVFNTSINGLATFCSLKPKIALNPEINLGPNPNPKSKSNLALNPNPKLNLDPSPSPSPRLLYNPITSPNPNPDPNPPSPTLSPSPSPRPIAPYEEEASSDPVPNPGSSQGTGSEHISVEVQDPSPLPVSQGETESSSSQGTGSNPGLRLEILSEEEERDEEDPGGGVQPPALTLMKGMGIRPRSRPPAPSASRSRSDPGLHKLQQIINRASAELDTGGHGLEFKDVFAKTLAEAQEVIKASPRPISKEQVSTQLYGLPAVIERSEDFEDSPRPVSSPGGSFRDPSSPAYRATRLSSDRGERSRPSSLVPNPLTLAPSIVESGGATDSASVGGKGESNLRWLHAWLQAGAVETWQDDESDSASGVPLLPVHSMAGYSLLILQSLLLLLSAIVLQSCSSSGLIYKGVPFQLEYFFLQSMAAIAALQAFAGARMRRQHANFNALMMLFIVQVALLVEHSVTIANQHSDHPIQIVVRAPFIAVTAFGLLQTLFLLLELFC